MKRDNLLGYSFLGAAILFALIAGIPRIASILHYTFPAIGSSNEAGVSEGPSQNPGQPQKPGNHAAAPPPSAPALSQDDQNRLQDCLHTVEGQLLFQPQASMVQGKTYPLFARITRNPNVNIAKGLDTSNLRVETATASCNVSMQLKSEEPDAFLIDPPDATNQFVQASDYAQWNWSVTPKNFGNFHLLLSVTPKLWMPEMKQWLNVEHAEPPREIVVKVAYGYEGWYLLRTYWEIWAGLTAGLVALVGWIIKVIRDRRAAAAATAAAAAAAKPKGFGAKP